MTLPHPTLSPPSCASLRAIPLSPKLVPLGETLCGCAWLSPAPWPGSVGPEVWLAAHNQPRHGLPAQQGCLFLTHWWGDSCPWALALFLSASLCL